MTLEENKEIVRRHWTDMFTQGHVELLDEYYAPDGSIPDMLSPQALKDLVLWHHKIAPGFKITILDMIAEGDMVAVHVQADLTYSVIPDPPPVPPTYPFGKPVSWRAMELHRVVNGKLVAFQSANEWEGMLVKEGVYTLAQTKPA